MMSYNRRVPAAQPHEEEHTSLIKLTSKQLGVYYWLVANSNWNFTNKEQHYYIYKSEINKTLIAKQLGISRPTASKAFSVLCECGLIEETTRCYKILFKKYWTFLNVDLIKFLLIWSKELGADILLFYSILKRYYELQKCGANAKRALFTVSSLVEMFYGSKNQTIYYRKIKLYLAFLEAFKLIELKIEKKEANGRMYFIYEIEKIEENITEECEFDPEIEELGEEYLAVLKEIKESLDIAIKKEERD